jgi:uncharacterized protein YraI
MRILSTLIAFAALAASCGAALARDAETKTELAMHAGRSSKSEVMLTMPAGAIVHLGACSHGWCKAAWNSYSGYVSQSGLIVRKTAVATAGPVEPVVPVYPPHPYHAGHYPTADSYYDLPPYTAISPGFYRWRFFLMAQERNRYRYVPHWFYGNHQY